MAKKIQLLFNSPIVLLTSLISIGIFVLQNTTMPQIVDIAFSSNTTQMTEHAFDVLNPLHYIRLFTLIFGHTSMQSLCLNVAIIILLGERIEERFGSLLLIVMFAITSFVAGIFSAIFLQTPICGLDGIAFLFLMLTLFEYASLKSIPFSHCLLVGLFLANSIVFSIQKGVIGILFLFTGAFFSSLFGYLDYVAKKNKPRKKTKTQTHS